MVCFDSNLGKVTWWVRMLALVTCVFDSLVPHQTPILDGVTFYTTEYFSVQHTAFTPEAFNTKHLLHQTSLELVVYKQCSTELHSTLR